MMKDVTSSGSFPSQLQLQESSSRYSGTLWAKGTRIRYPNAFTQHFGYTTFTAFHTSSASFIVDTFYSPHYHRRHPPPDHSYSYSLTR